MTRRKTRVGIDVGGTKCLGVVLDDADAIVASIRYPTPSGHDLVDALCQMVSELCNSKADTADVSVGVGLPGLVTFDGVFRASPHIADVVDLPVAFTMSQQLNMSVRVDNDATAATYAEWQVGAARGASDAIIVTFGTGIGGGIVAGGQLQRGAHGHAGEFGHIIVDIDGPQCACGQHGCWEMYASGSGLRRLSGGIDGEEVMARAMHGDKSACDVVEEFSRWVGRGLAGLTNALDPTMIVIGGGLVRTSDVFLAQVARFLGEYAYGAGTRELPDVVPAQLGEHAGAIGSALLGALQ